MKYDVFISYSRKDLEFAKKVCTTFDAYKEHYEFEYFFDMDEIKSRHEYLKRISTAISKSKVMLFLASGNSTKSEFCTKELLFADKHNVFIHQYRIDDTELPEDIDLLLGNHHYREAANFSIDNIVREVLSDALKQDIKPISKRTVSKGQASTALVRVDSDTKCRVLRFGNELAIIDKGVSELHLPKGKQKLSFVNIENSANRFDYMLDIRDLDYEEYIEVKLNNKCAVQEPKESCNPKKDTEVTKETGTLIDSVVGAAAAISPLVSVPYYAYKTYKTLKNDTANQVNPKQAISAPAKTYKVGDYYDDGKKQGVVFEVSADGKHGKIVSLKESRKLWATDEYFGGIDLPMKNLIGTNNKLNGAYNMSKVKAIAGWRRRYPAFAWCANLGEGWYLPAIEELKKFICNDEIYDKVNFTLSGKGKILLNKGDYDRYWSSTEGQGWLTERLCALQVEMYNCDTCYLGKSNPSYVRAVSAF